MWGFSLPVRKGNPTDARAKMQTLVPCVRTAPAACVLCWASHICDAAHQKGDFAAEVNFEGFSPPFFFFCIWCNRAFSQLKMIKAFKLTIEKGSKILIVFFIIFWMISSISTKAHPFEELHHNHINLSIHKRAWLSSDDQQYSPFPWLQALQLHPVQSPVLSYHPRPIT